MNVLIIGSGGREHAFAWKIAQSNQVDALFVMPGNAGTQNIAINVDQNPGDFGKVKQFVLENHIDFVLVGPEQPLVDGIYDFLISQPALADVYILGPGKMGAMLEGSKDFSKAFMERNNIPTARYQSFDASEIEKAKSFLESLDPPYVLKADGLAAGKGVLIVDELTDAFEALDEMFQGKFGAAGKKVIIEEYLSGIELSVFVLTDGEDYLILPEAKDYKRIGEGDTGLNTGGMGAVSPVPFADKDFLEKVEKQIIGPTLEGLRKEEIPYKGFIFIGLMNCQGNPYVIEYNVRMGDPETQAVLPRIKNDFFAMLLAAAKGELGKHFIEIESQVVSTVVLVSGGYPGAYEKGKIISGLDKVSGSIVFHAGTSKQNEDIVSSGGRVMALTAYGNNINEALAAAKADAEKIHFEGKYFRGDIGIDLL